MKQQQYMKGMEIVYLIVALFFVYEAYCNWSVNFERSMIDLFLVAMALFMCFFRRRFRRKLAANSETT